MIECFTRSRNPATLFTLIEVLIIKNVVLFLGPLAKSLFIIKSLWHANAEQWMVCKAGGSEGEELK